MDRHENGWLGWPTVLANRLRHKDQFPDSQAHEKLVFGFQGASCCFPERGSPAAMGRHSFGLSLQGFHTGCGQMDQPFQEIGNYPLTATGQPKTLPGDVAFPKVACVEQIDSVQVGAAILPFVWLYLIWNNGLNAK